MSPRILGYAVLAYAALTSGVVLGLVRLILKPGGDGWWTLGGAVLWLAYVAGGFGNIFGRPWSRLVLLAAAAASALQSTLGVLFLSKLDVPPQAYLFYALMILPHVAIFVGALRLPVPAAWQVQPSSGPIAKRVISPRFDLAYGCFLFSGLAALLVSLMGQIPMDDVTAAGLGFFVVIPLVGAWFIALVIGIVLSIRPPRHWALVILAVMSALFVSGLFIGVGQTEISIVYGVGVVAISGCWFLIIRKREDNVRGD